jgi:hypothetical protein
MSEPDNSPHELAIILLIFVLPCMVFIVWQCKKNRETRDIQKEIERDKGITSTGVNRDSSVLAEEQIAARGLKLGVDVNLPASNFIINSASSFRNKKRPDKQSTLQDSALEHPDLRHTKSLQKRRPKNQNPETGPSQQGLKNLVDLVQNVKLFSDASQSLGGTHSKGSLDNKSSGYSAEEQDYCSRNMYDQGATTGAEDQYVGK